MSRRKQKAGPAGKRSEPASDQEIIEGLKPFCICRGIRMKRFLQLLRQGVATVEDLQKATGAGSGSCSGKRCTPRIEELLRQEKKK